MKKLILLIAIALAGCTTTDSVKPNDPVITPQTETVNIPKDQLTPCPDLEIPELKALSQGQTLDLLGAWFKQYTSCQLSHNGLIPTVKKAFNVKD